MPVKIVVTSKSDLDLLVVTLFPLTHFERHEMVGYWWAKERNCWKPPNGNMQPVFFFGL